MCYGFMQLTLLNSKKKKSSLNSVAQPDGAVALAT